MNANARVLMACGASFALGVLVTLVLSRLPQSTAVAEATPSQATLPSAASVAMPATAVDALVQQVLTIEETQANDPFAQLEKRLNEDAAVRARVFELYEQQIQPNKKARLRMMLSFVTQPDVFARVQTMLASTNPAQRSEAYVFFRVMQEHTPAAHELLLKALSSESNEAALVQAIDSVAPQERPSVEQRKQAIIALKPLQQSPSVKVRAAALVALCRWDSRNVESLVAGALNDASPNLRGAGMAAAMENQQLVKTARVKAGLLKAVSDDALDVGLRSVVTELLQSFELTAQEEQTLAKVQQSLRAQTRMPT